MADHALRTCALAGLLLLGGCSLLGDLNAGRTEPAAEDTAATRQAELVVGHLRTLDSLARASPVGQAAIVEEVHNFAAAEPSASNRLLLAAVLSLPGHDASDTVAASAALGELLEAPDRLLPGEIALANVMLQHVNARIALTNDHQRQAADAAKKEQAQVQSLGRRQQALAADNARLRQELAEALAKLEAVTTLERNVNKRRNNADPQP